MLVLFLKSIFYDMHFSRTYKRAVIKTKSATPSSFSYEFPITRYWLNVRLIKTKPSKQSVHSTNLYCDHTQQTRWIYCLAFKWQNLMFGHVCSLLKRRGGGGAAEKTRGNAIDWVSVRSNAFDPTHSLINFERPLSLIWTSAAKPANVCLFVC